jgi:hypothetical protein
VGGSKKQTIGYKYSLGIHAVSLKGPVDALKRITFAGDKIVYSGSAIDEQISINKPDAFGGESKEGGVVGSIDVLSGGPTQTKNDYLQSQFGTDIPAFRGVAGLVFRQVQLSNHPYLKPWVERWQRIHVRQDGIDQWYDEKAEITIGSDIPAQTLVQSSFADGSAADISVYDTAPTVTGPVVFSDGRMSVDYTGNEAQLVTYDITHDWSGPLLVEAIVEFISASAHSNPFVGISGGYNGYEFKWAGSGGSVQFDSDTFGSQGTAIATDGEPVHVAMQIDPEIDGVVRVYIGGELNYSETISFPLSGLTIWLGNFYGGGGGTQEANYSIHEFAVRQENKYTGNFTPPTTLSDPDGVIYSAIRDMNPAHIIRECITDQDWGSRHPESDCDDADWTPAADALYAEEFGLSYFWDNPNETIDELKEEILRHIDATLYVSRSTGKFILKLIRDDYDEGSLITLDESNISRVENYVRQSFGELTNTVTVRYWDASTGNQGAVTVDNPALVQMQGGVNAVTIDYPAITNKSLAVRVALRDLRALSTDLVTCTIYANSAAKTINPGDAFKFEFADYHDGYLIMRADKIAYGDGRSDRVRIECAQDVFSISTIQSVSSNDTEWTDPSQTPDAATYRIVDEAPYYELVQRLGESQTEALLTDNEYAGFLVATAANPGAAINAILNVDAGSGYEDFGVVEFSPYAFLDGDLAQEAGPSTFAITGAVDVDDVVIGTHFQIGSELMRVDAVSATSITAGRGVLDTVPAAHTDGDVVIFWDEYAGSNEVEYGASAEIDVKLLPSSGAGTVDISSAPADTVTFDQRAYRPYPPGNVKINTSAYPESIGGSDALTVSWSHRDRQLQTAGTLQDTTETDIGPEAGTTYTLRIYGENGTLLREESAMSVTTYEYGDEISDDGVESIGTGVSLLLFNGSDGSTTFTDESGKTWTAAGDAQIDTAQSKSGGASGLFDQSGDYIYSADDTDWHCPADFTIEMFIRPSSIGSRQFICGQANTGASDGRNLFEVAADGTVKFAQDFTGSSSLAGVTALSVDTWYHIAASKEGSTLRLFVNGSLEDTVVYATTPTDFASPFCIGRVGNYNGLYYGGHIEDFRFINDTAIYTEAFTPPASPLGLTGEGGGRLQGILRIELESVRDSLTSHQHHDITVLREGYGFNYGKLYGGSA